MNMNLKMVSVGSNMNQQSSGGGPLMPRAVAMWLIENTALTFEQISSFCRIYIGEVAAMADGDIVLVPLNPIQLGQLTQDSIDECTRDPSKRLVSVGGDYAIGKRRRSRRKYTPIARRQDKPNAIAWLLKNCPEMDDGHIMRLIGTTKSTIAAVRDGTHWNSSNIKEKHPLSLRLCTEEEFEQVIYKVRFSMERANKLKVFGNEENQNEAQTLKGHEEEVQIGKGH